MRKAFKKLIFTIFVLIGSSQNANALCAPVPGFQALALSTFCWHCAFPFVIAGVTLPGPVPDPTMAAGAYMAPMSICPTPTVPPLPRPCINLMYWDAPVFHEVAYDAGCFPSLGFQIPLPNLNGQNGAKGNGKVAADAYGKRQVHAVAFAPLKLLSLLQDVICVDPTQSFDVLDITEFNPVKQDETLANIVAPESALMANVVTQLSCIVDSISTQFYTPNDGLFWCQGSWGGSYPFDTSTGRSQNNLEAANNVAAKHLYFEHRTGIVLDGSGRAQTCFKIPMPIWQKSNYRYQLIHPIPNPFAHTIGQSSVVWALGRDIPLAEDPIFVLFKRRGCCMLSDETMKTNIQFKEVRNGFNIYTWDWTEEAKEKYGEELYEPVGVIAQQVQEVYPEAVSTNERGNLVVDYRMLAEKIDPTFSANLNIDTNITEEE